ncbi:DNA mismatch repair protein MSH7 [Elaeis guineensis]|uniref:DNA mismatch repair protein n=1 Tax=Elaeis guineensis var. tenera TaxID=51953 RepID=A0A6I9QTJ6_ELAGV|nr:DNA mismatch repair protein MSH7 isoform X1 [Elaeis guineensis]
MQRQKSILSFLHKPSPENQRTGGPTSYADTLGRRSAANQDPRRSSSVAEKPLKEPSPEIQGTDTPPEKPRRPIFPAGVPATDDDHKNATRSFSSIMHKFTREGRSESSSKGNQDDSGSLGSHFKSDTLEEDHGYVKKETRSLEHAKYHYLVSKDDSKGMEPLHFELHSDVLGPETPATRPLVPRLKRVQEDPCDSENKYDSLLLSSSKRLKSIQDSVIEQKTRGEVHESLTSKFEWLNPSAIRDANRRRPSDPLYDKRTLYLPPDALKKMSASQKQYWSVKCQYMDVVLFFKVGKFYELYELDAEIGQRELDWKMTMSGVGKCRQVGISEAGIDDAVQKLIARGYKVGRMEQLETSDQAKARGSASVIQRKLVEVSTPSTITDGSMGPDAVHLLALKEGKQSSANGSTIYGFAFLDYAALKFWVGSVSDDDSHAALGALLMQVLPREVIYESSGLSEETHRALTKYASAGSTKVQMTPVMPGTDSLDASKVRKLIHSKGYFRGSSNSWSLAFDCLMNHDLIICALGELVGHLSRLMLDDALRNGELLPYHVYKSCLRMDGQTLTNLEIFSNNVDGGPSGTLYKYLDHCITASGKRLLRRWICHPLKNIDDIKDRLNIVEGLIKDSGVTYIIAEYLHRLPDLERLLGRVKATVGSSSMLLLPLVGERVLKQRIKAFGSLVKSLRVGINLLSVLQKKNHEISSLSKIVNLPMLSVLDELLHQYEVALDDDFPQYQDHDVKDSDAETLGVLVELFVGKATEWSQVINALNCIDVLQSFAQAAFQSHGSMSRPVFLPASSDYIDSHRESEGPTLQMKGLWHPYAVAENEDGLVPNDIYLGQDSDGHHPCALLLTGPNMGGKSTLLRATCLAVILAQLGCYVPCEMCALSPADVIFTRLGATDRIMSGESTFFVECAETASVLQNATQDSLVLLDELGRGTSTFDGYAIAYAVFRHLVERVRCRLLFATHYHPLTKEFASHPHVSLQHMACAFKARAGCSFDRDGDLVFLYRLASGACPESYGLQVALMAGIPKQVVETASKASQRMKLMIGENFKSSEGRSKFSTLHEEWLKTLLSISGINNDCWDDDASDTLLCLWHELKGFYR